MSLSDEIGEKETRKFEWNSLQEPVLQFFVFKITLNYFVKYVQYNSFGIMAIFVEII